MSLFLTLWAPEKKKIREDAVLVHRHKILTHKVEVLSSVLTAKIMCLLFNFISYLCIRHIIFLYEREID